MSRQSSAIRFSFQLRRVTRRPRLDFLLESEQSLDYAVHAFEGVFSAMLQAYMCRFAAHFDAQRDRPAIGVPDYAARRLRGEHSDPRAPQQSFLGQTSRTTRSAGFFIRHKHQPNFPVEVRAEFLQGANRIEHRYDAAL